MKDTILFGDCLQTLKEIDPKLHDNIEDVDIYNISNTNNVKEYFITLLWRINLKETFITLQ